MEKLLLTSQAGLMTQPFLPFFLASNSTGEINFVPLYKSFISEMVIGWLNHSQGHSWKLINALLAIAQISPLVNSESKFFTS